MDYSKFSYFNTFNTMNFNDLGTGKWNKDQEYDNFLQHESPCL